MYIGYVTIQEHHTNIHDLTQYGYTLFIQDWGITATKYMEFIHCDHTNFILWLFKKKLKKLSQ